MIELIDEQVGRMLEALSRTGQRDNTEANPARHHDYVRCEYYDALNMYLPREPDRHTPCWATMYRDERHKLVSYHGLDYGELYDLERDPLELINLWEEPAAATLRAELTQKKLRRHGRRLRPRPRPDRPLLSRPARWPLPHCPARRDRSGDVVVSWRDEVQPHRTPVRCSVHHRQLRTRGAARPARSRRRTRTPCRLTSTGRWPW